MNILFPCQQHLKQAGCCVCILCLSAVLVPVFPKGRPPRAVTGFPFQQFYCQCSPKGDLPGLSLDSPFSSSVASVPQRETSQGCHWIPLSAVLLPVFPKGRPPRAVTGFPIQQFCCQCSPKGDLPGLSLDSPFSSYIASVPQRETSQGCHWIPLSYPLLSFCLASCLVIVLLMVHSPDVFPGNSQAFFR